MGFHQLCVCVGGGGALGEGGWACLFRGLSLFPSSIYGGIQTTSKMVAVCQEQVGQGAFRTCQAQNLPPCAERLSLHWKH